MPEHLGPNTPDEVNFPDLTFREPGRYLPEVEQDLDAQELAEFIGGLEQRLAAVNEIEVGMVEGLVKDGETDVQDERIMNPGVIRVMKWHDDEDGTDTTKIEHGAKRKDERRAGIYDGSTELSYVKDATGALVEVTARVSRPTRFRTAQPQQYTTWSAGEGFRGGKHSPAERENSTAEQAREFLGSVLAGFDGLLTEANL